MPDEQTQVTAEQQAPSTQPSILDAFPGWDAVLPCVMVIAVVTAVLTQVFKLFVKKWVRPDNADRWSGVFMLTPVLLGGPMGILFAPWPWGFFIGAVAGAMSSFVFAKVTAFLMSKIPGPDPVPAVEETNHVAETHTPE